MFKWKRREQSDASQAEELRDDEVEKARGGIIAILIGLAKPREPERPAEFRPAEFRPAEFQPPQGPTV